MKTNIQDLILNTTNYMLLPFPLIQKVGFKAACFYAFLVNKSSFYTDPWFYCKFKEIEDAIGMGRSLQENCIDTLKEVGVLLCETRKDSERGLLKFFNVSDGFDALAEIIAKNSETDTKNINLGLHKNNNRACTKTTTALAQKQQPRLHENSNPDCIETTTPIARKQQPFIKEEVNKEEVNKEEDKSQTLGLGFEKLILNSDLLKSWIAETGYQVSEGLGVLLNEYFIKKNTKKDANAKKSELQKFLNKAQAEKTPDVVLVEYVNQALKGKSGKPWAVLDWYEENIQKLVQKHAVEVVSNSLLDSAEARALWGAFATAFTWEVKANATDGDKETRLRNALTGRGLMQDPETEFKSFVAQLPVGVDLAGFVGILATLTKYLGAEYQNIKQNVDNKLSVKPRTESSSVQERMGFFGKWVTGGQYVEKSKRSPIWKVAPSSTALYFPPSLKSYFLDLRKSTPALSSPIFAEFWNVIFPPAPAKPAPKNPPTTQTKITAATSPAPYKTFQPVPAPQTSKHEALVMSLAENEEFEEGLEAVSSFEEMQSWIQDAYSTETQQFQATDWERLFAELHKFLPGIFSNNKN